MTNAVSLAQQASTGVSQGFKNRIINGAMTINQRSSASYAPSAGGVYTLDRWLAYASTGTIAVTQSSDAPAGFNSSFLWTTTTGGTRNGNDYYEFVQLIEGFNSADLNWGTANAKTVTLSFWVKSSVTGVFGVLFRNNGSGGYASYVTSYTINAANTWEYKTITVAGPTTGTWNTTNGQGIQIWWDLGSGTSFQTTSTNTWLSSGAELTPNTQVALGSVTGSTYRITGVQFEVGSSATSFETRPYGTELMLCQRYLPAWSFPTSTLVSPTFVYSTTTSGPVYLTNPVAVRTPVTGITVSAASNFSVSDGDSSTACNGLSIQGGGTLVTALTWSTASGRTAFRPHNFFANTTNAFILGTGCEL